MLILQINDNFLYHKKTILHESDLLCLRWAVQTNENYIFIRKCHKLSGLRAINIKHGVYMSVSVYVKIRMIKFARRVAEIL